MRVAAGTDGALLTEVLRAAGDPGVSGVIATRPGVRVLVATRPVDFRRGAPGLAALAAEVLGEDPFSGTVLVFRAKRADPGSSF